MHHQIYEMASLTKRIFHHNQMSYRGGDNYRQLHGHNGPQRNSNFKPSAHKNNRYNSKYPAKYNGGQTQHNNQYQNQYLNQYQNGYQNKPYQNKNYQNKSNGPQQYQKYNNNGYNQQEKKFDPFQIWMGDLDPNWDDQAVIQMWNSVGESPIAVKILKDKSGMKPPYCFVSFNDQNQISSAIQKNGQPIPGTKKHFKLNWASGGGNANVGSNNAHSAAKNYDSGNQFDKIPGNKADNTSCFIGELPVEATETLIFERFNQKYPNQVRQVKIMYDPITRVSKGYGFVKFNSQEIAKKALEMNGIIIGSKPIKVGTPSNSNGAASMPTKLDAHVHIAQSQPPLNQFTDANNTTLIVRNLNQNFSQHDLELAFLPFGDLVYCKLSQNRHVGYVKYYLRSSAETALLILHGTAINNCHLKISWGNDEQESSSSTAYKKSIPSPLVYGQFNSYAMNLSSAEIDSQITDGSELLPITNELYVNSKLLRDRLLESSY